MKLQGTIYGGDPFSGLAVIEDTKKKSVNSFLVGDRLSDKVVVAQIFREKVILDLGDHREYLALEKKPLERRRKRKSKKGAAGSGLFSNKPVSNEYREDGFERVGGDITISSAFVTKC